MEILKHGTIVKPTCDITCRRCQSVLRVMQSDGKYVSDQRDGDYIEVACPLCKQLATILVNLFR